MSGERIVVRGTVQGVGFRPLVAKLARARGLSGAVRNDGSGVTITLHAEPAAIDAFMSALLAELPPLARVQSIERRVDRSLPETAGFAIIASERSEARTDVAPDAAPCAACLAEIAGPHERRFRYPFTSCTHCGPRYSIVEGVPYDRASTTMWRFAMCAACAAEYRDETDRRYHAQPIACPACGPRIWLERWGGAGFSADPARDPVGAAAALVRDGHIVGLKGVGGFQLLADATRDDVVERLRRRKQRDAKPLAVMARDLDVVARFSRAGDHERAALTSSAAPIVLLERGGQAIAASVAPGVRTLGVMLPSSPLHHLLLQELDRPVICTSGNHSDEPPCITDDDARRRLAGIADWLVVHDRPIAHRADDSVIRLIDGEIRTLRRARGLVPGPIAAPPGFGDAPAVLAMGGQFKATVCMLADGRAIVSAHLGDLDHAAAFAAWQDSVALLAELVPQRPSVIAVDAHPGYRSTAVGLDRARSAGATAIEVFHHHAHIAACLFENGHPRDGGEVLGIAFDGLGLGPAGQLWGGEFLAATYSGFRRVGSLRPVPLLGGDAAAREPWRNLWAQLRTGWTWREFDAAYGDHPVLAALRGRPRELLDQVLANPALSPPSSSIGRLFDAVAAATGLAGAAQGFEGQAAMALEAAVTDEDLAAAADEARYRLEITAGDDVPVLDPAAMWPAILDDVARGEPAARISARFHVALADGVVCMAAATGARQLVALSGGVWQNRVLFELVAGGLRRAGFSVLSHRLVPSNDGGLSLGQVAVAAARVMQRRT